MAQLGTPYLIPFGVSGMVAHPNRWKAQAGELVLAENVVVENDLLQKDPTARYYDPSGFSFVFTVGDNTSGSTLASLDAFAASPTTALLTTTLQQAAAAPGTPWVLTVAANAAVGSLHAVGIAREAGTGGVTTLVDSKANVYTKVHTATGSGMQLELWTSILTTALVSAVDTLTFTLANGAGDFAVVASTYSGVTSATPVAQSDVADLAGAFTLPSKATDVFPLLSIAVVAGTDPAGVLTLQGNFTTAGTASGNLKTQQFFRLEQGHRGIQAQIEWESSETNAPAGTVSITEGGNTVTGAGTAFLTAYRPGDEIIVAGETERVDTITTNVAMTVIGKWSLTATGAAHTRRAGPVLITSAVARSGVGLPQVGALFKERPSNGHLTNQGQLNNVTLSSTLNPAPQSSRFVVGGKETAIRARKLFFFNGVDPVQVAMSGDGTLAAAIATPSADWGAVADAQKQPINGIVHQDSLMAFGNLNDPHRLYVSSPSNHENFDVVPPSDSITIKIASQIGQRLYGAAQYQGILHLWKYPHGIFYLDDTPADRLQWGYRIRSASVGCAPSPHAVLSIDDDVIFCDPNGHFHLLSAVNTLGGTRDSDITRKFGLQEWTRTHVDTDSLDQLLSTYDPQTKTAWFALRSADAVASGMIQNDLIIRWDFSDPNGAIRMTTSRQWNAQSLCIKRRNWTGTQAVVIAEMANCWFNDPTSYGTRVNRDYVNAQDVTLGVATRTVLPELDFGDRDAGGRMRRKTYRAISLVSASTESPAQPVEVEMRIDGTLRQTVPILLGVDREPHITVVSGSGYTLELTLTTDGTVVGDLPAIGITVWYDLTGQKPVE